MKQGGANGDARNGTSPPLRVLFVESRTRTSGPQRLFDLLNRLDRVDKLVLNLFVTARKSAAATAA